MRFPYIIWLGGAAGFLTGCATSTTPPASGPSASKLPRAEFNSPAEVKPLDQLKLRNAAVAASAHNHAEAAAIYEEELKLHPDNVILVTLLARNIFMQAEAEPDAAKSKALHRRARALAVQAQKLGATDAFTPLLIENIKEDGTTISSAKGTYSSKEKVDQLILDGEAAFKRHAYDQAVECYREAYDLEPTNYTAALLTGDAYFATRQFEPACEWFRKAIAVSPDKETAHRYLADALNQLGQREQAFSEWVEALICEPYQRLTQQHFTDSMRRAAESRGHFIPRFPAMRSTIKDKQVNLAVDPDDGPLIIAYNLAAVAWRSKEFAEQFPQEKTPRRSLPEEIHAIDVVLEMAQNFQKSEKSEESEMKKLQPVIDRLIVLKQEGLLEAFVFFERHDQELAMDYINYRAAHRENLRRYIWVYWCGFE